MGEENINKSINEINESKIDNELFEVKIKKLTEELEVEKKENIKLRTLLEEYRTFFNINKSVETKSKQDVSTLQKNEINFDTILS